MKRVKQRLKVAMRAMQCEGFQGRLLGYRADWAGCCWGKDVGVRGAQPAIFKIMAT